jgi:hypothetical protein
MTERANNFQHSRRATWRADKRAKKNVMLFQYRLGVEVPLLIRLLFAIEQLKEFGSNLTHFVPVLCSAVGEEQRELVTANETVSVSVEQ